VCSYELLEEGVVRVGGFRPHGWIMFFLLLLDTVMREVYPESELTSSIKSVSFTGS
jgi:hypothetical protein